MNTTSAPASRSLHHWTAACAGRTLKASPWPCSSSGGPSCSIAPCESCNDPVAAGRQLPVLSFRVSPLPRSDSIFGRLLVGLSMACNAPGTSLTIPATALPIEVDEDLQSRTGLARARQALARPVRERSSLLRYGGLSAGIVDGSPGHTARQALTRRAATAARRGEPAIDGALAAGAHRDGCNDRTWR